MMVGIRKVDMPMPEPAVSMPVAVRFVRRVVGCMAMTMVFVMDVFVRMRHGLVFMVMLMPFGQMQPHAHRHQDRCGDELIGARFIEQHDRENGPKERRR
jgi:hypothetical protein